ncbi:hypothetical protein ABTD84_20405, partial [Acinetobacter baumannii]
MRRFGVIVSLFILPALLCVGSVAFGIHPTLMTIAAASVIKLSLEDTLDGPAAEILFLPLAPRVRLRAQVVAT